jgi:flagellar biosynthesis protein FlhB
VSESAGEKTHDATPQKREQARKEGRFAKSRDIGGVVGTAAVLAVVLGSRAAIGRATETLFVRCHGDLGALARGDLSGVTQAAFGVMLVLAAPAAAAATVIGACAGFAQSGGQLKADVLAFKPERLNPFPALAQLFSPKKGSLEVLMSLLRVGVVGYVAYRALLLEVPGLLTLSRLPAESSAEKLVSAVVRVVTSSLFALAAIAAIDYAKSRFTLEQEMKMSRQEIMDETRSQDGDPKVKGRMRARSRAMARKRALANVKNASVIVANPTHISVALRYTATDPAPVVIAKGHDELAMQIRAIARKHGVPILENRPLARALDAEVQIGHPVPAAHFAAVARVLAFVFRLRGVNGTRRA